MGWAAPYIEKLKRGETVQFRPRGHSMTGRVNDGQLVTVEPLKQAAKRGDVVLCKVNGREYLHLVKAVKVRRLTETTYGEGLTPDVESRITHQYLIGNNRGGTNGWTTHLYGRMVKVE